MKNLQKIEYIVIHHNNRNIDMPLFIKARHKILRHFEDIGYHYIIGNGKFLTKDGKVYSGRSEEYEGAHASDSGFNHKSIGICLIGNFEKKYPTRKQIKSLIDLLKEKQDQYQIPTSKIIGHNEVQGASTKCPGKYLDINKLRNLLKI